MSTCEVWTSIDGDRGTAVTNVQNKTSFVTFLNNSVQILHGGLGAGASKKNVSDCICLLIFWGLVSKFKKGFSIFPLCLRIWVKRSYLWNIQKWCSFFSETKEGVWIWKKLSMEIEKVPWLLSCNKLTNQPLCWMCRKFTKVDLWVRFAVAKKNSCQTNLKT